MNERIQKQKLLYSDKFLQCSENAILLKESLSLLEVYSTLLIKKGYQNTSVCLLEKSSYICYNQFGFDFLDILLAGTGNALISFETKKKRKGGTTVLVPFPLEKKRQVFLAVKNILLGAAQRKDRDFSLSLVNEIIDTINGLSFSYKLRQSLEKKAEASRAYAFLRWN